MYRAARQEEGREVASPARAASFAARSGAGASGGYSTLASSASSASDSKGFKNSPCAANASDRARSLQAETTRIGTPLHAGVARHAGWESSRCLLRGSH